MFLLDQALAQEDTAASTAASALPEAAGAGVGAGTAGLVGQLGKGGNGIAVFAAFGLDHAFEKAHLGIAGLAGEVLVHLAQSFAELPGPHEAVHLGVIVGLGHDHSSPQRGRNSHRERQQAQSGGDQGGGAAAT